MTTRRLPEIKAFTAPAGVDWDSPLEARELWTPVKAAAEDERTLTIASEIGDRGNGEGVTTAWVRGALRRMGKGTVTVNINSTGGDFFTGLAIYNMLREHDGEVHANVLGVAASAASLIAMASDKLRVAKAGFLMVHNAWAIALGNRIKMRAVADLLEQFDGAMASVYAERSGIPIAKIKSYMDDETFFNGETAVANGMADALLESDEIVPDEEPAPAAALRRVDLELAKQGLPRSERRALLSGMTGSTPRAAPNATPCAGATEVTSILTDLISSVRGSK